jgi:RNA polymerase sigma-70 factor (ECF subfamily)
MKDAELRVLAIRIKASDPKAFEWVFNLFQAAIYRFLLFKTKDHRVAEDLLQDVFLKLWRTRALLNETQSLKNYLYTIADNLALNHIRHSKVVSHHHEEVTSKLFTCTDNPDFLLEEREWNDRLKRALEALPDKTRVIFLMSRIEDLTYDEIAERLGISKKTVEGNIVKALKQLRETFSIKKI